MASDKLSLAETDQLLDLRQAAALLGYSIKVLRRRVAQRDLPAVHLSPRAIRIRASALRQFIEDCETPARQEQR